MKEANIVWLMLSQITDNKKPPLVLPLAVFCNFKCWAFSVSHNLR
jgi:hypothetical protein